MPPFLYDKMKERTQYITILDWMLELTKDDGKPLTASELIAYARIYGFSQGGNGHYYGSLADLAVWLGMSKRRTLDVLQRLERSGLLKKHDIYKDGQHFCEYRAMTKRHHPGDETSTGV